MAGGRAERDGNRRRSGVPNGKGRLRERAARRQKRWQLATGSTGTAAGEGGRRGPRAPGTPPGGGNWHVRPRRPRPAGVGRKERRGQGGSAWVGLFSRVFGLASKGEAWVGWWPGLWWGWGICRPDHLMCCPAWLSRCSWLLLRIRRNSVVGGSWTVPKSFFPTLMSHLTLGRRSCGAADDDGHSLLMHPALGRHVKRQEPCLSQPQP